MLSTILVLIFIAVVGFCLGYYLTPPKDKGEAEELADHLRLTAFNYAHEKAAQIIEIRKLKIDLENANRKLQECYEEIDNAS